MNPSNPIKAIVLFSGGLDSTTCLYEAKSQEREVYTLTMDYAQRHVVEIEKAKVMCERLGIPPEQRCTLQLPLGDIAISALTHHSSVPQTGELYAGIPPTYVPGRNVVFLALALSWAESIGAREIWTGVNALDYSGYPDCRGEFISAFSNMVQTAVKSTAIDGEEIKIITPLLNLTKTEIVRKALSLKVPIEDTHSCYAPDDEGNACGKCDSCLLRIRGISEAMNG